MDYSDVSSLSASDVYQPTAYTLSRRWQKERPVKTSRVVDSSNWEPTDVGPGEDVAVMPGEPASNAVLARETAREALTDLLQKFAVHGFSMSPDHVQVVSPDSAKAAAAFLRLIPLGISMPQVAPDGEGGALFVWEQGARAVLIGVDESRLYVVRDPNTVHSTHFESSFDGESIPRTVIDFLASAQ